MLTLAHTGYTVGIQPLLNSVGHCWLQQALLPALQEELAALEDRMQVLRRRNSTLERMLGQEQAARTTTEHEVGLCLPQGFWALRCDGTSQRERAGCLDCNGARGWCCASHWNWALHCNGGSHKEEEPAVQTVLEHEGGFHLPHWCGHCNGSSFSRGFSQEQTTRITVSTCRGYRSVGTALSWHQIK